MGHPDSRHSPSLPTLPSFFPQGPPSSTSGERPTSIRGFEKGLAYRGGRHKQIPPTPWIQAFFLPPFSYAPLRVGEHNLGGGGHFLGCILGAVGRQPPPANHFSKPLNLKTLGRIGGDKLFRTSASQKTKICTQICVFSPPKKATVAAVEHNLDHISKKYAPKICHKMRGRMA